MHLIKELKTNLFIENDILSSEMIDISNSTESIYIDSCDVIISIITKTDIRSQFKSIHALKAFMISSKSKCLISVHNIISLSNRNFLFEPWKTTNLSIYAHILDSETSSILVRNDQNRAIMVSVYPMGTKDKEFLDKIFDKLHQQGKLSWTTQSTSFFFSCFVVWREAPDQKKARIVVDIRDLNVVVQSNTYSVSLQIDILTAVNDCNFISIIDCSDFFLSVKSSFVRSS